MPNDSRKTCWLCTSAAEELNQAKLEQAGARFSKVPRLFGRISGDIILFVSSKRRCPEARNFADILIFISYTTYEKISFTEWAGRSFTNGFSGPKSLRDFRETGPRAQFLKARLS